MKYLVFWLSLAGVPLLAKVLSLNHRWMRWAFFGMIAGLYFYQGTAINFLSREHYTGTARGMEVSLLHLLALAVLLAWAVRGKREPLLPEGGIRIYAAYFLLCLPGLLNADDLLVGWFEVWKMLLLFVFWHAMYAYLRATDDVGTVVKALAFFAVANCFLVLKQHYAWGMYQAVGVFPIWNSLGAAMNLLGGLFFAGYLQLGPRDRLGALCTVAFAGTAASAVWSYSRAAIATMPVAYVLAALGVLAGARRKKQVLRRLSPMAVAALAGLCMAWGNIAERFLHAPKQSGETRKEMAVCAREMIREHPFAGVGINNCSLNMQDDHPYRERAEGKMGKPIGAGGVVETLYLLVGAECGIPAALALLAWFGWHAAVCWKAAWRLRGTEWLFVPAGLAGGISANALQGILDWALRQPMNLFLLVSCFAMAAHLSGKKRDAA